MLPSEAELMRRFGASRMTVNRAMRELAAEGYVERAQGRGSFVADLHRLSSTMQVRDLHEEIAARGHRHDTEVLLLRAERAAAALARRFEVPAGARLYHSVLVHYENGLPIQYEDRYVNPQAAPAYLQCDFTRETPTHHLLAVAPLTEAEVQVEARLPTTEQAARLRIGAGAPCLVVSRRTKSGARVASCATLVYPGSRYRLEGRFGA
jgi:GntR family histidine utilization transcriptional repressor